MISLEKELRDSLEGNVHFDDVTRQVYSVDASIFEVTPLGVVIPKHLEDLRKAVQIAAFYRVPFTVRGAATGITGGCLGKGLILDLSKSLTHILAIDPSLGYAICEPGVIQDELNQQLAPFGMRLGPDTSTGNRATIGGMLANNAAGSRSLKYGKMSDHVESVNLLLSDGSSLRVSSITEENGRPNGASKELKGIFIRHYGISDKKMQKKSPAASPRCPDEPQAIFSMN